MVDIDCEHICSPQNAHNVRCLFEERVILALVMEAAGVGNLSIWLGVC